MESYRLSRLDRPPSAAYEVPRPRHACKSSIRGKDGNPWGDEQARVADVHPVRNGVHGKRMRAVVRRYLFQYAVGVLAVLLHDSQLSRPSRRVNSLQRSIVRDRIWSAANFQ